MKYSGYTIQIAISSDYGVSWINPTIVTGSIVPDLSISTKSASYPQVVTNASGTYVNVIWQRFDNETNKETIQAVNGVSGI